MIDTHCHLTFPDFAGQVAATIDEARQAGVMGMITVSTTSANAGECQALARAHDCVWCTSGVHPLYADQGPHDWQALARVARDDRCVAWGELGLDNHYDRPPREIQDRVLSEQIAMIEAQLDEGVDLPVVLHCREAFDDLIPILRASRIDPSRFVFHCFTGDAGDARTCLDFGAMISLTGVVTYPNAREVQEAARLIPADRIMVETDAPFLSPVPHRGKRPCRPPRVRHTADPLASIRGVPLDELHQTLNATTARFPGIRHPS